MKFSCDVLVGNRSHPELAIKARRKHVKSTLAICQQPKSDKFYIILFTAQNESGTRYDINGNVSRVLTRFMADGKITIQFKQPTHDLYVQADRIQLKSFLNVLACAMGNNPKKITCLGLSAAPTPIAKPPLKRLVIQERSQYPSKGLPRTLEELRINHIEKMSVDFGILKLQKLKILDLSHNRIEFLPGELSNLCNLISLNVSFNQLGKGRRDQWQWLGGALSKSLGDLDLRHNNLQFIPDGVAKFKNLEELHFDNNQLTKLPSGLGNIKRLKCFTASFNLLQSVPGSLRNWKLNTINISHNNFQTNDPNSAPPIPKTLPCCSLKEIAGKRVLGSSLEYGPGIIPTTLVRYLDLAKFCVCGSACFDVHIKSYSRLLLPNISKSYVLRVDENYHVPMDCYYCSIKCVVASSSRERIRPIR